MDTEGRLHSVTVKGADTCHSTDEPGKHCNSDRRHTRGHRLNNPQQVVAWSEKGMLTGRREPQGERMLQREGGLGAMAVSLMVPHGFQLLSLLPDSLASCLPARLTHTKALCRRCPRQSWLDPVSLCLGYSRGCRQQPRLPWPSKRFPREHSAPRACDSQAGTSSTVSAVTWARALSPSMGS